MNTFKPTCVATWASQMAGMDDQLASVDQALADINRARETLAEIEQLPELDEAALMRKSVAEYIVRRRVLEAQSIQDVRSAIRRAKA